MARLLQMTPQNAERLYAYFRESSQPREETESRDG
jgi:hypothetical protein